MPAVCVYVWECVWGHFITQFQGQPVSSLCHPSPKLEKAPLDAARRTAELQRAMTHVWWKLKTHTTTERERQGSYSVSTESSRFPSTQQLQWECDKRCLKKRGSVLGLICVIRRCLIYRVCLSLEGFAWSSWFGFCFHRWLMAYGWRALQDFFRVCYSLDQGCCLSKKQLESGILCRSSLSFTCPSLFSSNPLLFSCIMKCYEIWTIKGWLHFIITVFFCLGIISIGNNNFVVNSQVLEP